MDSGLQGKQSEGQRWESCSKRPSILVLNFAAIDLSICCCCCCLVFLVLCLYTVKTQTDRQKNNVIPRIPGNNYYVICVVVL